MKYHIYIWCGKGDEDKGIELQQLTLGKSVLVENAQVSLMCQETINVVINET